MSTLTHSVKQSKSNIFKRRILWSALALIGVLTILFSAWYVFVWGRIDLEPQKLVDTTTCGAGDYRLLEYRSDVGNGRLDLVDRSGKIFGTFAFSPSAEIGQPRWDDDCKGVRVGSGDDARRLEVPASP